ncbi:hypothetical protein IFM89_038897, partial [Coptis chinensis]
MARENSFRLNIVPISPVWHGDWRANICSIQDLEMGFEKIVKIAHARGVCKRQDALSKLKVEREQSIGRMDAFLRVVTSIPGIDNHDSFLFDIQSTMKLCAWGVKTLGGAKGVGEFTTFAWKMGVIMENGAAIGPSLSAEAKRTTCKLEWPPVSWRIHSSDNDDDSFVDENMWGGLTYILLG